MLFRRERIQLGCALADLYTAELRLFGKPVDTRFQFFYMLGEARALRGELTHVLADGDLALHSVEQRAPRAFHARFFLRHLVGDYRIIGVELVVFFRSGAQKFRLAVELGLLVLRFESERSVILVERRIGRNKIFVLRVYIAELLREQFYLSRNLLFVYA